MLGAAQAVFLGAAGCASARYAGLVTGISGLLAYWRLSEAGSIVDETAGNRDGTYDGTVTLVSGLPADSDEATSFPGDVVGTIPHDAGLLLSAFSLSLWVNVTTIPASTGWATIFSKDQSGNVAGDFYIYLTDQNELTVTMQAGGSSSPSVVRPNSSTGTVYHVVVTADASGFDLWVDGEHVGHSSTYTGAWTENTQAIQLATAPHNSGITEMILDEVALYDRVLTSAEIVELSQNTDTPTAVADSASVVEEQTVEIDVVANDSFVGQKADLTITITSQGSHGTATVNASNDVEYTAGTVTQQEEDIFSYKIEDANGESNTANVTVTVSEAGVEDAYGTSVTETGDLVAYWRLGDTSTSTLVDSSGNGHTGSYSGSPILEAAERSGRLLSWQQSDGKAVDFDASGHGTVPHDAAFELAQGSVSFYFKATQNAINNGHHLINKSDSGAHAQNMGVRLLSGGALRMFWQDGSVVGDTIAGAVEADVWHHCMVTWTEKMVRLWLDGRQVRKSPDHTSGLSSNSHPWTFGRDHAGGNNGDVALDEIALYAAALTYDEIQALSEHVAGLGYTDAQAERTVNVSNASELSNALSNAAPGDHIVLANGTYSGSFSTSVHGSREEPIVIRSANGPDNVTIGGDFDIEHDWNILDGVTFSGGFLEIQASHSRATRIVNESFATSAGGRILQGSMSCRLDHSLFGPPNEDSGGSTSTNQCVRVVTHDNPPEDAAYYSLVDHIEFVGPTSDIGNGRDGLTVAGVDETHVESYTTFHRCFTDGYNHDEVVSLKSAHCFVQFCTFKDSPTYTNNRHSRDCEWRSSYWLNTRHHSYGDNHWWIGCVFDSVTRLGLPGGEITQPDWEANGGSTSRVASRFGQIIGCDLRNGTQVDVGKPTFGDPDIPATGWTAEGNTNFSTDPADSDDDPLYDGTLTDSGPTDEPFELAVQITASDVGPDADDGMVPPVSGWN